LLRSGGEKRENRQLCYVCGGQLKEWGLLLRSGKDLKIQAEGGKWGLEFCKVMPSVRSQTISNMLLGRTSGSQAENLENEYVRAYLIWRGTGSPYCGTKEGYSSKNC